MHFTDHCNPNALKPIHCFPWYIRYYANVASIPTHLSLYALTLAIKIVIVTHWLFLFVYYSITLDNTDISTLNKGKAVAGTRGCTWFVRAPSNNCTISPTDKWISRGGARTVGACTAPREEQGPPHVLRHVRLPHGRCPNLWQPAASQLNPPSFHKTNQTPRCPQQLR